MTGRSLTAMLQSRGYAVAWLSRSPDTSDHSLVFHWDPAKGEMDKEAFGWADALVHLAGKNIGARRWTAAVKEAIVSSRVNAARLLCEAGEAQARKCPVVVSMAAMGLYGDRGDAWIREDAGAGKGFLSTSCVQWEKALHTLERIAERSVILRGGMIFSRSGGVLPRLAGPLRSGICPVAGDGRQYYAWIHIDDLCSMICFALENAGVRGTYNAVSPFPIHASDCMRLLQFLGTSRSRLRFCCVAGTGHSPCILQACDITLCNCIVTLLKTRTKHPVLFAPDYIYLEGKISRSEGKN